MRSNMKLTTRFALIFLLINLIVLAAVGVISFNIIKDEVNFELKMRFMDRINRVTEMIKENPHPHRHRGDRRERSEEPHRSLKDTSDNNGGTIILNREDDSDGLIVKRLDHRVEEDVVVSDTLVYHPYLDRMESSLKVAAYRNIEGTSYYIATYGVLLESDDIIEAVTKIMLWILLLQIIGGIMVGFFVSKRLFKPFRDTINGIKNFNLLDRKPIKTEKTSISEFAELNHFVEEMTRNAVHDYEALKEFAENASHELQTPLSIAKGKLELLGETQLTSEQYQYVESSQRAISKLSRLSESLALLTKIENREFEDDHYVNLANIINESLQSFDELLELQGISVEKDLEEEVSLQLHPSLADILWTNLFQNAIKHNIPQGWISIHLDKDKLAISNTGKEIEVEPEELFSRFKKGDQSSQSIGLGLSIVNHIVYQKGYCISYDYDSQNHIHTLSVYFNP